MKESAFVMLILPEAGETSPCNVEILRFTQNDKATLDDLQFLIINS